MRRLREDRGLSQAQLAEAADLSTQYVAALEQESRTPTLRTIDKLCGALNVTPAELFDAGSKAWALTERVRVLMTGLTQAEQQGLVEILVSARNLLDKRKKGRR